ncbi:DUF4382 domain-containing protein [Shewanella sp. C32]|uniref:DUF4382 domain-containing protein n=1 Tax=Shewanella electrica TaxID=515560 RepID=A0ABT2FLL6_9GAMM|nr:DUF4382 domain-containing protein [Shewanella electrica]MCH1924671.1 DUF4382 domain-containing protein [Shewanella electrica]MCS4556881.1 DUF4382 domain-containing protein [Shewanella electrica]
MKRQYSLPSALLTSATILLLTGCGGSDSPAEPEVAMSRVSFAVSDAPVDSAEQVVVAFDQIELIRNGEENIVLDVQGENGATFRQIDLLQYQGSDSTLIVSNEPIPTGSYDNLILHVLDESSGSDLSYVVNDNGQQIPLKQPSNRLRLGGFTVAADSVQQFTIEFNLRQSLVENQNGQRYNLKPHGVTIVNNAEVASISGTVDVSLFNTEGCSFEQGNFVYLYPGHGLTNTLADLYDPEVNTTEIVVPAVMAYTSAPVTYAEGNFADYQFGFIPAGDYTIAFSCSPIADDPEQFDGISIPNPAGQVHEITVTAGQTTTQNFTPIL